MTAPPPPSTTHVGLAAFTGLVDLASAAVGGAALLCSDDFFAPMERLVDPRPAAFDPDAYTDHGKLMDGWESRRRRTPGHDWCILRLGVPGRIRAVDIDTSFFLGNHGPFASLDATDAPADADAAWLRDHATWTEVLPSTALQRGSHNLAAVAAAGRFTHVRLHMYPDGGVARLRVIGHLTPAAPDDPLVRWLNAAPDAEAHAALLRCCGSRRWADAVLAGRPYASRVHLHGHAEVAWWRLGDGDWREAFTHHPRIGADPEALKARFASTATWSSTEQAGVVGADPDTLRDLAAANTDYEQAFGHVFLVCATGLRADEMLARLRDRMGNSPANELRVAAGEQVKITRIRLDRLGDELSAGASA